MTFDSDILKCPITLDFPQIDKLVVASDGFIYDEDALIKCLKYSNNSPMTREPITTFIKCVFFNELLKKYLKGVTIFFSKTDFICPCTGNIFIHPVLHEDGHFYEENEENEENITCKIFNNLLGEYLKGNLNEFMETSHTINDELIFYNIIEIIGYIETPHAINTKPIYYTITNHIKLREKQIMKTPVNEIQSKMSIIPISDLD
jgi:hypothetical protein